MTTNSRRHRVTTAEARVVFLYLLSLALRPVEGLDDVDDWDAAEALDGHRPALYVRRGRLSEEWATVANLPKVRAALGRTRASERTLGRSGFTATVEQIEAGSKAYTRSRYEEALATVEAARAASVEWQHRQVQKPGSKYHPEAMTARDFFHEFPALRLPEPPETGRAAANALPICQRQHASTVLVRLRRDLGNEGRDVYEEVAVAFGIEPETSIEDLREEAEALGFSTAAPIPAEWTVEVRQAADLDDDEDDDDQAEPVEESPAVASVPAPRAAPDPEDEERRIAEHRARLARDQRREQQRHPWTQAAEPPPLTDPEDIVGKGSRAVGYGSRIVPESLNRSRIGLALCPSCGFPTRPGPGVFISCRCRRT